MSKAKITKELSDSEFKGLLLNIFGIFIINLLSVGLAWKFMQSWGREMALIFWIFFIILFNGLCVYGLIRKLKQRNIGRKRR